MKIKNDNTTVLNSLIGCILHRSYMQVNDAYITQYLNELEASRAELAEEIKILKGLKLAGVRRPLEALESQRDEYSQSINELKGLWARLKLCKMDALRAGNNEQ